MQLPPYNYSTFNVEARKLRLVLLVNRTPLSFAFWFMNQEEVEGQQNAVQFRPRALAILEIEVCHVIFMSQKSVLMAAGIRFGCRNLHFVS